MRASVGTVPQPGHYRAEDRRQSAGLGAARRAVEGAAAAAAAAAGPTQFLIGNCAA